MKKTYDSKFKSSVALEALRGELTIAAIASVIGTRFWTASLRLLQRT